MERPKAASPLLIGLGLAVLILIWGSTWAAIRIGLGGIPPLTGVAIRFALAALLLWSLARIWGVRPQHGARLRRLWAIETAFGFCLSYGVVYWAEQWVASGLGAVLFATMPLFVGILAHFTLRGERLTGRSALGIGAGFLGVAVIYSEDLSALGGADVRVAAGVFLLSPIGAAISHVFVKKWGGGIHPLNLTIVPMGATAVVMGALAWVFEADRPIRFDAVSIGALLYLVVLGTAVTFTLYYWILARVRATRLALITYCIPIVALLIGSSLLAESLSSRVLAGSGLVIAGVALATRR